MTESYLSYFIASNVLTILSQITVWIVCLLIILRRRSLGSILLLLGSTLFTLSSVSGIFIQALLARTSEPETLLKYNGILALSTALFYAIFAIGFVIFVLDYLKLYREVTNSSSLWKKHFILLSVLFYCLFLHAINFNLWRSTWMLILINQ